jgi:hypothetical protein
MGVLFPMSSQLIILLTLLPFLVTKRLLNLLKRCLSSSGCREEEKVVHQNGQ